MAPPVQIIDSDPDTTDPALLRKHSTIESVETQRFRYSGIRVFYRRHPQAEQLPVDPGPLPLLVCVHGLGGSAAQFHPLLTRLTSRASCLAIDLPGCGRSAFSPMDWEAYSTEALVELLEVIIKRHQEPEQGIVLIGHSMGCSLAARLAHADPAREASDISASVVGLVAICPPAEPPPEQTVRRFRWLLWIPTPLFDLWRAWDRRGGLESASVRRFVGDDADEEAKRLQYRFNSQSKTPVWRRMAWGSLPRFVSGRAVGGLAGRDIWAALDIPICLIAGQNDHITPAGEVEKILGFMESGKGATASSSDSLAGAKKAGNDAATPFPESVVNPGGSAKEPESPPSRKRDNRDIADITDADFGQEERPANHEENPSTPSGPSEQLDIPPQPRHPAKAVESHVLPAPANHALLYMPSTVGVVSGLISKFLGERVTGRLDLGWQLRFLSREGKWDVKNLEKWKRVEAVSQPIAGVFRAMKTLREVDEVHSPHSFVKKWGRIIKDVIDISHDNPVYDYRGLEKGGIQYHKFPTVSKTPPTDTEVKEFVELVDRIRETQKQRAAAESWDEDYVIGVHCHYGFNRTGYFIVCYLVDRCGFELQAAVEEFARARPNGIRHAHFLDALCLRYAHVADKNEVAE